MKKLVTVFGALLLLCGCGSKYESVDVNYLNSAHAEVVKNVLGDKLGDEETKALFDQQVIEVYYNALEDHTYDVQVWNASEYYFSGEVAFPECGKSINVEGIPPKAGITAQMVCEVFDEAEDFEYRGNLYERKAEKQIDYTYEIYYYEEYPDVYDYVLSIDEISEETMKQFADYLYEEFVLQNVENATTIYLYTAAGYEITEYDDYKGTLWIDQVNDFVEISDPEGNLIERINYRQ